MSANTSSYRHSWRGPPRWGLLGIILSLSSPVVQAASVGIATVTNGEVRLIRAEALYSLVPGVDVEAQDVVVTGDDGFAQLEMADGSIFNIDASSKIYLSEYRLRDDQSVETAAVSLLVGFLRFVASSLQPESRYELATNDVTVGVRGTEGVIEAGDDTSRVLLEEGRVEVFELDAEGNLGSSRTVVQGELVERRRGAEMRWHSANSAEFRARWSRELQRRPTPKLRQLRQRGIRARKLRDVNYGDVRRLMNANPRIRKNAERRFERRMRDPRFRNDMQRDRRSKRQRQGAGRQKIRAPGALPGKRARPDTPRTSSRRKRHGAKATRLSPMKRQARARPGRR